MHKQAAVAFKGDLKLKVIPLGSPGAQEPTLTEVLRLGFPQLGLPIEVNIWRFKNIPNLLRGMRDIRRARKMQAPVLFGFLYLAKILRDGTRLELGMASVRVVTTAGVNFIVDAFQGTTELENLKYHGFGTGTNAEASGDTALQTELTTQYNPDNTRPTGSLTEGASANIYRTVGTVTVDASAAITEHGIFSQAATGGGTLLDRSVFSVVNLQNGESLQATYELTCTAGG